MKVAAIFILMSSLCFANTVKPRPKNLDGLPLKFIDYVEDEKFDFDQVKGPEVAIMNQSIASVIRSISDAFTDSNSLLAQVINEEKIKAIYIQIGYTGQNEENPYPCPPIVLFHDQRETCALSAYIHFYKGRVCTSTKNEFLELAAAELRKPTCVEDEPRH